LSVLFEVVVAFHAAGEVDKAKQLLSQICESLVHSGDNYLRTAFSAISKTYVAIGLNAECEAWIDTLEAPYAKATALLGLANGILDREASAK
jgi:hypothetical protein